MGARKDGKYEIEEEGGGAAVSITSPIGQQPMAGSVSVVIASNQTSLPVTFSGTASVVNIERTVTGTLTNVNDSLTLDVTGLGTLVGYATTNDATNIYGILGSVDGVNYFYNVGPFYTPTTTSYLAKTSPLSLATADFAAVGITPQFKVDVAGLVSIKFVRTSGSGSAQTWVLGASAGPLPSNNFFLTGSAGHTAAVDVNGAVSITALSLPLPTGAATEATLNDISVNTNQIFDWLSGANGPILTLDDALNGAIAAAGLPTATAVTIQGAIGAANPVLITATSLPLPTGAATQATLATRATEATLLVVTNDLADISTQQLNGTQYTRITDGTTSPVAVKPALTPATTSDKALVVAISPNNTIPISGSISATVTSSSLATATALNPSYTEGVASALSQDLTGNLRTKVSALVSTNRQLYDDGDIKPLSLNRSGQLRILDESDDIQKLIMLNTKIYSVLFLILHALDSRSHYNHDDIDSDPSELLH